MHSWLYLQGLHLESVQTVFHTSHFERVYLKNIKSDFFIIFTEKGRNHIDVLCKETIKIFSFSWEISALKLLNPFFWDTLYSLPYTIPI